MDVGLERARRRQTKAFQVPKEQRRSKFQRIGGRFKKPKGAPRHHSVKEE